MARKKKNKVEEPVEEIKIEETPKEEEKIDGEAKAEPVQFVVNTPRVLDVSSLNAASPSTSYNTGNKYENIKRTFQAMYDMGYQDANAGRPRKQIKLDDLGNLNL